MVTVIPPSQDFTTLGGLYNSTSKNVVINSGPLPTGVLVNGRDGKPLSVGGENVVNGATVTLTGTVPTVSTTQSFTLSPYQTILSDTFKVPYTLKYGNGFYNPTSYNLTLPEDMAQVELYLNSPLTPGTTFVWGSFTLYITPSGIVTTGIGTLTPWQTVSLTSSPPCTSGSISVPTGGLILSGTGTISSSLNPGPLFSYPSSNSFIVNVGGVPVQFTNNTSTGSNDYNILLSPSSSSTITVPAGNYCGFSTCQNGIINLGNTTTLSSTPSTSTPLPSNIFLTSSPIVISTSSGEYMYSDGTNYQTTGDVTIEGNSSICTSLAPCSNGQILINSNSSITLTNGPLAVPTGVLIIFPSSNVMVTGGYYLVNGDSGIEVVTSNVSSEILSSSFTCGDTPVGSTGSIGSGVLYHSSIGTTVLTAGTNASLPTGVTVYYAKGVTSLSFDVNSVKVTTTGQKYTSSTDTTLGSQVYTSNE